MRPARSEAIERGRKVKSAGLWGRDMRNDGSKMCVESGGCA